VPPSLGRKRPRKQQSKLMLLNHCLRHNRANDKKNFALQHKFADKNITNNFNMLKVIFSYWEPPRPVLNDPMTENPPLLPPTQGLYGPPNPP
jgi:hypothetical protein